MQAQRFAAPKTDEGIDPRQLFFAAMYNQLMFLEYAANSEDYETYCRSCREPRAKWDKCEVCGTKSYHMEQLVQTVTFFESEMAYLLCREVGIDYKAFMEAAKERFWRMPEELQKRALAGAKEWWEDEERDKSSG